MDRPTGGSGQELAQRYKIGITAFANPSLSNDEFIAEIAKVCNGPAERGQSQAKEYKKDRPHVESLVCWQHCKWT